ncbi:MAG: MBL fold metallo-hydrolase [Deltaproteobacteria bacterium]|nr:MBL fold metallo-hydrolase [Deltaproteobacteria bacterium]
MKSVDKPTAFEPYRAAPDTTVLPAYFPIPGFGILAINAFLVQGAEPVLVDTGLAPLSDDFMNQLAKVIDLEDLRWLWLTHADPDHIGSLQRILDAAPKLRVITTFLAAGKMSLFQPIPLDRAYFLNPGQKIDVGDRTLVALKPPTYDAPETTGFYDVKSGALFCADCFGALLSEPAFDAADIGSERLKEGLTTWTKVDSPWLHSVNRKLFAGSLDVLRELSPSVILSGHLPPAHGVTAELLDYLEAVPEEEPFVGPDQPALEAMLKQGKEK